MRSLIRKTVPKSSVIGMMWQADDNYKVVLSDAKLLAQHDPFTWIVEDGKFAEASEIDAFARYTKVALESWLDTFSRAERRQLVNIVFDTIYGAGIDSFSEITEDTLPSVLRLIAEIADTPEAERKIVLAAVRQFFTVSKKEIPAVVRAERGAKLEEQSQKIKTRLEDAKTDIRRQIEEKTKK